jgi:geranylgeranyl reductase family protein
VDAEVIVVGAGPAGAAAAYWLARYGRRVLLLDREEFPRDKSCGDAVGAPAVRLLDEMGVLRLLEKVPDKVWRIGGTRMHMYQRSRDFLYRNQASGLVVPRLVLDDAIREQAAAEGAEFLPRTNVVHLLRNDGVVSGVEAMRSGRSLRLRAPIVVVACGAATGLLSPSVAERTAEAEAGRGQAVRGYLDGLDGLTHLLEIYAPLTNPAEHGFLPSYGWVFPTGPSSANVGVGVFGALPGGDLAALLDGFVGRLSRTDQRFSYLRKIGSWATAPMRFDFVPERCSAPGMLLVGDAAGMSSPFTGEGIGPALESGRLAAETIHDQLRTGPSSAPDLSGYTNRLKNRYIGHFEAGRRSARRHLLVWRVLHSTFDSERPLFTLGRQALLFSDGFDEPYVISTLGDVGGLLGEVAPRIRADLFAVGDVLLDAVRREWPFLARMTGMGRGLPGVPFRPALLTLLAGHLARPGQARDATIIAAAAVELGYLSALAGLSITEDPRRPTPSAGEAPANWGNMLALTAGDFLLGKANELAARAGTEVSRIIGRSLATATEGRVRELRHAHDPRLTTAERISIQTQRTATLFELPCRLGALLCGATAAEVTALSEYGRRLGLAFQLTDEARSVTGETTRMGTTLVSDLTAGIYGVPVLHVLRQDDAVSARLRNLLARRPMTDEDAQTARRLIEEGCGDTVARSLATEQADQARTALRRFARGPTRHALEGLVDHVLNPQPNSDDRESRSAPLAQENHRPGFSD